MYHLNCDHWHPFVSQISDKLFTETIQKNKRLFAIPFSVSINFEFINIFMIV